MTRSYKVVKADKHRWVIFAGKVAVLSCNKRDLALRVASDANGLLRSMPWDGQHSAGTQRDQHGPPRSRSGGAAHPGTKPRCLMVI